MLPNPQTLGDLLYGYLAADLVNATGASIWTVRAWKRDESVPTPPYFRALDTFLGLTEGEVAAAIRRTKQVRRAAK